jgi:Tfp pilus assembly protein PilX
MKRLIITLALLFSLGVLAQTQQATSQGAPQKGDRLEAAQREEQRSMNAALDNLRDAERNLQNATHDKGGHRRKALDLVRRAIEQVQEGIKFDNRTDEGGRKTE